MGDTDSERFFALITLAIREAGSDVRSGIIAAVRAVAAEYELYSLNFVLGDLGHIWAFRYPEHNPLHLQRRPRGGPTGAAPLDEADTAGTLRMHSDDGALTPLVVIASERISDEPGWEEIHPGELVHVGPDLEVEREIIISQPPAYPMVLTAHEQETQSYD
jgi:glutamine amidotransferase